jgi:hypothetical protein
MTINRKLRVDPLGSETLFHIIDANITDTGRKFFEQILTDFALGYTKQSAIGGWRGTEEQITVYRVASLTGAQIQTCIKLLLDARFSPAIGRIHRDVYVVIDGRSYGYSYEYEDTAPIELPRFHGQVDRKPQGWRDLREVARTLDRLPQLGEVPKDYHGTRDTGWRSAADETYYRHRYATDWR